MLEDKIEHSIQVIKHAEKLALKMQPNIGFHVGFSGGKDSQVLLELVKLAGVRYTAIYNVTTNDYADNIRFIRKYYPDVYFDVPKKSYFQLIGEKGLPTVFNRWCCALFKESKGVGFVVLTGVRREESVKRSKYNEIAKFTRKKEDRKEINLDIMEENQFRCVNGKDKFMVYPILEWTEKDVWDFIKLRGLPINPCYKIKGRVGCAICPFCKPKDTIEYIIDHPKQFQALIHAIDKYLKRKQDNKITLSAKEVFEWWLTKDSLAKYLQSKNQTNIDFHE